MICVIWDKRLAATGAALAVVAAMAVTAALLPGQTTEEAAPIQEPVSGIEAPLEEEASEPQQDYLYLIREHEGRIAVFAWGSDTPELIFEKQIKFLPDYDRIQLAEGIPINSVEELNARIEDYIS